MNPLLLTLLAGLLLPLRSWAAIELVIVGEAEESALPRESDPLRSSRTITEDEIRRKGLSSLEDVLASQPGLLMRSMGGVGSFSVISMRGSTARQVAVYVDGLPVNSADGGPVDLSRFPLSSIERIEIHPGYRPVGFEQGSAGVIHIVTRKTAERKRLHLLVGSFGLRQAGFSSGWKAAPWSVDLGLDSQRADNDFSIVNDKGTPLNPHDDRDEPRRNNGTARDALDVSLMRAGEPGNARLGISLSLVDQKQEIADRLNDPLNDADLQRRLERLELSFADAVTDWSYRHRLQLRREHSRYRDLQSRVGLDAQDNRYRNNLAGYRGQLRGQDGEQLALSLSREEYRSELRLGSLGFEPDVEKYRRDRASLTLEQRLSSTDDDVTWQLVPQLLFHWLEDRALDSGESISEYWIGGQLGLSRTRDGVTQSIHLSRERRYPGFGERFADHGYTVGNPDLSAETLTTLTLHADGVRPLLGSLAEWRAEAFVRDSRDLIVISYDARGIGRYDNISRAWIAGLEWEIAGRGAAGNDWSLAYALTGSRSESPVSYYDGKQVPNTPLHKLNLYFAHRFVAWPRLRGFLRLEATDGAWYDRSNLLPVKNCRQLDVGVEYRGSGWQLDLQIRNLGDQVIEAFNGFPGPGRSWQLSLRLDL